MPRPEIKPKTELAGRLRAARRAMGDPDRKNFAKALNISFNSLAYYERGDNEPTAATLLAYMRLCNLSPLWLISGEGEMFNDGGKKPLPAKGTDINAAHLRDAVRIVDKALLDTRLAVDKKAELIQLVYTMLKHGGNAAPLSRIIDLLRSA